MSLSFHLNHKILPIGSVCRTVWPFIVLHEFCLCNSVSLMVHTHNHRQYGGLPSVILGIRLVSLNMDRCQNDVFSVFL